MDFFHNHSVQHIPCALIVLFSDAVDQVFTTSIELKQYSFAMFWFLFQSIPLLLLCLFILSEVHSRCLSPLIIFHNMFDLYLRLTTSSLAVGSLILFIKCVTPTPFLRTAGEDVPTDIIDTICSENSSNSSLPTAWFEEVKNEILFDNFGRFELYCLVVIVYSTCFLAGKSWAKSCGKPVREIIPLASSTIFPNDNKEEHKRIIVQRMINKVGTQNSYFRTFLYMDFFFLLISIVCFLCATIKRPLMQDFAVHLNGSEWTVDCDRRATWQDVYALTKCQLDHSGCKFRSISIVPTDKMYIYLYNGVSLCSAILAIFCILVLVCEGYLVSRLGSRRMNDLLLLSLLKKNVDYMQHKEIIDAFKRKLDERRRDLMGETRPLRQTVGTYSRGPQTINLSVGICSPD
ncbi:unnamed protein product [Larinioides sclopetarius]|uniref:Odorant receptor n=1 Tax=Larinioides sclopetarius TaxID=280406 RepID=A0AAV2BTG9_9ARAC